MTSSERIGKALNSGNLKNDAYHIDADLIASLAFASKLGQRLQSIASAGFLEEFSPAVVELTRVLKKACNRKKMGCSKGCAEIAAKQALREWLIRICKTCNGTGQQLYTYTTADAHVEKRKGKCDHCDGTGKFRPTWQWRMEMMELKEDASQDWWAKRIDLAKEIADDAFRAARREVTFQMSDEFD